jgi:phage tail-like protein
VNAPRTTAGRLSLDDVQIRHPLAAGLPAIFKPALTRDEARVMRVIDQQGGIERAAKKLGREHHELESVYEAARVKLGAHPLASDSEVAERVSEDDFISRLCDAFDEVLAPIVEALDTLETLLDPWVCPPDFLPWLGRFVALANQTAWPAPAWRKLVAEAMDLYRARGTSNALQRVLELYAAPDPGEARVTIEDPGGSWVAEAERRPAPDSTTDKLVVWLSGTRRPVPDAQFQAGLDEIVKLFTPVHMTAQVVVQP